MMANNFANHPRYSHEKDGFLISKEQSGFQIKEKWQTPFGIITTKRINKMALDKKSSYYDAGGIEVIKIIKAKLTEEQFTGYCLGNSIKYSCRLNFKNDDYGRRDAEKMVNYSFLLKEHLKEFTQDFVNDSQVKVHNLEQAYQNQSKTILKYIRGIKIIEAILDDKSIGSVEANDAIRLKIKELVQG